jgi:uncharacterized protein YaiI (UPF0178 family)
MKIYVDCDACPVKDITEKIAKENSIELIFVTDVNHIIKSDYAEVITVSQGADSVDICLINKVQKGDIVVSQDYGVAAMALGKGACAIGNSGLIYTNENIDKLLFERFLGKKQRNSPKRKAHFKSIKKRSIEDDLNFEKSLRLIVERNMTKLT